MTSENGWKEGEKELRQKEVENATTALGAQRTMARWQGAAVALALIASIAAAYSAYEAGQTVRASEAAAAQQASDSQLSTAITAIGGATPTEQVAGLTLLRRNIATQLTSATAASDQLVRDDAFDAYATSLDVLAEYLRTSTDSGTGAIGPPSGAATFGLGYGKPTGQQPPFNAVYAADELSLLLKMASEAKMINAGKAPAIDLSYDELYGISLPSVNFASLSAAYLPDIDFRGANLANSRWGKADLAHAYFQCANLRGADFRGADLSGADLRGADLSGASFTGATVTGVKTDGAFGQVTSLSVDDPATSWNAPICLANTHYFDGRNP